MKEEKKRGRPRRAGKSKGKREKYFSFAGGMLRLAERRIRRILRHNGEVAARKWAEERMVEDILNRILAEREKRRQERQPPGAASTKPTTPAPPPPQPPLAGGDLGKKLLLAVKMTAKEVRGLAKQPAVKRRRKQPAVKRRRKQPAIKRRRKQTSKNPAEALARFFEKTKEQL